MPSTVEAANLLPEVRVREEGNEACQGREGKGIGENRRGVSTLMSARRSNQATSPLKTWTSPLNLPAAGRRQGEEEIGRAESTCTRRRGRRHHESVADRSGRQPSHRTA